MAGAGRAFLAAAAKLLDAPGVGMHEPEEENPFASPQVPVEASARALGVPLERHTLYGWWLAVVGAMFLGVSLLAVSPGLGVLFAIIAGPGLIAAWVRLERQFWETGQQLTAGRQLLKAVLVVMLFVPLLVVACVAFGVTCWTTAVVVSNTIPPPERPEIFWMLNWALPAGGAVGLVVYCLLFFLVLGKKPRREVVEDGEPEKLEEPHA